MLTRRRGLHGVSEGHSSLQQGATASSVERGGQDVVRDEHRPPRAIIVNRDRRCTPVRLTSVRACRVPTGRLAELLRFLPFAPLARVYLSEQPRRRDRHLSVAESLTETRGDLHPLVVQAVENQGSHLRDVDSKMR